jgi:hypothetical protein
MYALLFSLRLQSYNFLFTLQGGALEPLYGLYIANCNYFSLNF